MDLQDIGGAVESWMRKMASKASKALDSGSNAAAHGKGNEGMKAMGVGSGVGDLIELVDAFEVGDGEDEQDDGLLMQPSEHVNPAGTVETSGWSAEGSSDVRGRRRNREGGGDDKTGKGD